MSDGIVEAVAELKGARCRCGEAKTSGLTLCLKCFNRLPLYMKRMLYRSLSDGYMVAYKAAVEYLDQLKVMEAECAVKKTDQ